jgi:hypothetical protein
MACLEIHTELTENSEISRILDRTEKRLILDLFDSHGYIEFFSNFNKKYKPIYSPSLAWVRNTGENILSDGSINSGLSLNKKVLSKFSLEEILVIANARNSFLDYCIYGLPSVISFLGWMFSRKRNFFKSAKESV